MKKLFGIVFGLFLAFSVNAQSSDTVMKVHEDSLIRHSTIMINSYLETNRDVACQKLIKTLVQALKVENSFNYPFDSLQAVSILYPEDNSFRIFTWQLQINNAQFRHFGVVQMNTPELKMYPLFDASDFMENSDTIANYNYWHGALYYNMLQKKIKGEQHYFLFGYDANNSINTLKLIDVLKFDKKTKEPILGAPVFEVNVDSVTTKTVNRYIMKYKSDAVVTLNYDKDLEKIVFDHLIEIKGGFENKSKSWVPDGTYEGFEFKKNKWRHIEKMFHLINEGPLLPKPVFNTPGNG